MFNFSIFPANHVKNRNNTSGLQFFFRKLKIFTFFQHPLAKWGLEKLYTFPVLQAKFCEVPRAFFDLVIEKDTESAFGFQDFVEKDANERDFHSVEVVHSFLRQILTDDLVRGEVVSFENQGHVFGFDVCVDYVEAVELLEAL